MSSLGSSPSSNAMHHKGPALHPLSALGEDGSANPGGHRPPLHLLTPSRASTSHTHHWHSDTLQPPPPPSIMSRAGSGGASFIEPPSSTQHAAGSSSTTPTNAAVGGIDNAAVDVQGYYSQNKVNGVPLIPQELPSSHMLYMMTTSEGRDKMFKCLQYLLKLLIWLLYTDKILPEGSAPFSRTLAQRFAGNVLTIRNGRSMFRLGRWIITLFHVQVIVGRLMRKHAPATLARLEATTRAISSVPSSLCAKVLRSGNHKPASSCNGNKTSATPLDSMESSSRDSGCGASAALQQTVSPNRPRTVTFPADLVTGQVDAQRAGDDGETGVDEHDGLLWTQEASASIPGAYALPSRWRRAASDFSSPWMLILLLRCCLSVGRNVARDLLFLTSKEFLTLPLLLTLQGKLQNAASYSWLAVSVLDLVLNTYRLSQPGWFAYESIRRSVAARCLCNSIEVEGAAVHSPRTRRRPSSAIHPCTFAPTDLDFGSVTPTTAKFFEAASPEHMQPLCVHCGYVLCEATSMSMSSTASTPKSSAPQSVALAEVPPKRMVVPWMVRKGLDRLWVCMNHPNLTQTLLLQLRYLCDVIVSAGYAVGDFEPVAGEEPLNQHLHVAGSVAGLVSALVALYRVKLSAPSS